MSFVNNRQESLAKEIANILIKKNETVAVAESTSGGLASAILLSIPGASQYYCGGSILYTYLIRECIVGMGKKEHAKYSGSTPELILDLAKSFKEKLTPVTWVIGEGGAAGPKKSPYGHAAGYTALAVAGPINKTRTIETDHNNRVENMSMFATELLSLFLDTLKEKHNILFR